MLSGVDGFEHLKRDPQVAESFNKAMAELTVICWRAIPAQVLVQRDGRTRARVACARRLTR